MTTSISIMRRTVAILLSDILAGTGIPVSTVHRYLNDMKESCEIEYNGRRSISTECLTLLKGLKAKQPVGTKLMFPSL